MRDDEVEARIRTVLRAEGDALPLSITGEELERRYALRRRARTGRRLWLAAAAVGVVAIGSLVAASSGWFGPARVGTGPDTTATASRAAPEPTGGPSARPTEAGLPCTTIEPDPVDQPPAIILGATPGDSIAYSGALGAYRLGDRASGEEGSWTAIDPKGLTAIPAGPPTERLQALASNPDACLVGLVATAVPFGEIGGPETTIGDVAVDPTRLIEFDKPSTGDWLVRVHATFATSTGVDAWSDTFFRVDARNPAASLGFTLGGLPLLDPPPAKVFLDEHSKSLEPGDATGRTEETVVGQVPPRGSYLVSLVCLGSSPLRWSLGHEGQFGFLAAGDQPCDGTRSEPFVERGLPAGDIDVVLQGDPATAWRIRVATIANPPAFIPPALRIWVAGDADGPAGAAEAFGRCVSSGQGADQCAGEWFALDGARSILMRRGSSLVLGLQDGWRIDHAHVTAAVADEVRLKPLVPEYSVGFVEAGGSEVTVPVELGRGSWVVRVSLNASKGGETFDANYDLPLVIGE